MKKLNTFNRTILIPMLILNLTVFNSLALPILAEGDSSGETQMEGTVDQENQEPDPLDLTGQDNSSSSEAESENADLEEIPADSDSTVIETGDVDVEVEIENEANTNEVEFGITESEEPMPQIDSIAEEVLSDEAGDDGSERIEENTGEEENNPPVDEEEDSTETPTVLTETDATEEDTLTEGEVSNEEECVCQELCEECDCDCDADVSNKNEAIVENNVEAEGNSGENVIENNSGDALIDTGDVNIAVGVINTVNTNIIGSEFSQSLLNIFELLEGDINIEDEFGALTSPQGGCAETNISCLDITNQNNGEIENNIFIDGLSGQNTAESNGGDVFINTGDVNASASVFNLLNTNLVGSNWLSFIINVFADWTGDLIFPGKEKMDEFFQDSSGDNECFGSCGGLIVNSNEGQIENTIYVKADTGLNMAEGSETVITTGDAEAQVNVYNLVNTNIVDGSLFFIAINTFGEWKGNIYSLPSNLEIAENPEGIKIYKLGFDDFNSQAGASHQGFDFVNDNTGIIKNSIILNVSTGGNSAVAENGKAVIETGDANAFANLVNILNTNMVNTNWLLGIVNVFDNWQGDIAFGRPDLLIAESATTSANPATPGSLITYTLSYFNNGDADATGVTIIDDFDENFISVTDVGTGVVKDNPGEVEWDIGTVPTGGFGSVSYTVMIDPDIPYGDTTIENHSTIGSYEEDWNSDDNHDSLSVGIFRMPPDIPAPPNVPAPPNTPGSRSVSVLSAPSEPSSVVPSGLSGFGYPHLQITKTSKQNVVEPGSKVDYEIVLTNDVKGWAFEVVVEDVLYNESSEVINTYSWDLGEVVSYEEIIINYTVEIGIETLPGFYTNTVKARAQLGHESNEASYTIEVKLPEVPEEPVEEISFEEMEGQLDGIGDKLKKLSEELKRLLHPVYGPSSENPTNLSEASVPSISAQEKESVLKWDGSGAMEENNQIEGREAILKEFLAAIGAMPLNLKLILIILGLAALALITLRFFENHRK